MELLSRFAPFSRSKLRKGELRLSGASNIWSTAISDAARDALTLALLDSHTLAPCTWLTRLRRALREDRFVLHYQPILGLASGEVTTTRRWCASPTIPTAPPLAPGAWMAAAERHGLIRDIDRIVVCKAVRQLAQEPDAA